MQKYIDSGKEISTHTPLARRDLVSLRAVTRTYEISTHTPLARRDKETGGVVMKITISTHTPLARRDRSRSNFGHFLQPFLLTRLLRGATVDGGEVHHCRYDFYSHASCEARPGGNLPCGYTTRFLLTRLLRGATKPVLANARNG